MVVMMVLLIMDMGRAMLKRVLEQMPLNGRKKGLLTVTDLGTLREDIAMKGNKTGIDLIGIADTEKRRMAIKSLGEENVTWVMRMIGTEGSLHQDPGAGHELCRKMMIIDLDQGTLTMEREDVHRQSNQLCDFLCFVNCHWLLC